MPIKPIETIYRGHKFRSRLEARWAVALTHLGITWQYEPQGFEIGGAHGWPSRRYLPDFYLPNSDLWVEVKGDPSRIDWMLMAAAVDPGSGATLPDSRHAYGGFGSEGSAILILGNIPATPVDHILIRNRKSACAEGIDLWKVRELDVVGAVGLTSPFGGELPQPRSRYGHCDAACPPCRWDWYGLPPNIDGEPLARRYGNDITNAYSVAQQARFEWGANR